MVIKESLAAVVADRLSKDGDRILARFLKRGEEEDAAFSGAELDAAGRAIAAGLVARGFTDRNVVLMFEPGLDVLKALIGCLYGGAVAVPAPEPRPGATLERVERIARVAQAACILTSPAIARSIGARAEPGGALADMSLLTLDDVSTDVAHGACPGFDRAPDASCIIQYTSGSTTDPRGAMLSGANLLANVDLATRGMNACQGETPDCFVNWMPYYHDLSMVGNMVIPLVTGAETIHMSPLSFVQRPVRWLQAISRYRGRVSGGPGFAFDLCTNRVTDEAIADLDLSCWEVAFAGAEPIMAATMARFADRFAAAGLKRSSVLSVYGLAETCLYAAGSHSALGPQTTAASTERAPCLLNEEARANLRIVRDGREVPAGEEGEIWLAGPSVSGGYLESPADSAAQFRALVDPDDGARYLRTGDLGSITGDVLRVSGRMKDVLIRNGANYAAVDVERIALRGQSELDAGAAAAAVQSQGSDGKVVLILERSRRPIAEDTAEAIKRSMQRAVADGLGLTLDHIAIVPPGTLPRTTSGKLRRAHIGAVVRRHALERRERRSMTDPPDIDLAACREVLQNRAFDVVQPGEYFDQVANATGDSFDSVRAAVQRVLFFARGERHVELRKPVVDFFRPSAMLKWQPIIDQCVADVLNRLPAEGEVDLMTHYARPVATEILCQLIGFPVDEHEQFDDWTDDVRWLMEPLLPLRQLRRIEAALTPLARAAGEATKATPDPDLPGTPFLHHPLGGMAEEDRIWVAISMYSAGQVTMDTLGNILVEVARSPGDVREGLLDPERRLAIVDRLIATGGRSPSSRGSPRTIRR